MSLTHISACCPDTTVAVRVQVTSRTEQPFTGNLCTQHIRILATKV